MKKIVAFCFVLFVGCAFAADQWDIVYRSSASTGPVDAGKISELTEEASPAALDWLLGELASGELRKFDVGNLPFEGSLTNSAGLASALSDETGTGLVVFNVAPNLQGVLDMTGTAVDDDDCTGQQGSWWWDSTDTDMEFCIANSGAPVSVGSLIQGVVGDTSPQLGGDLDANGFDVQFDDATGIRDDSDNETVIFGKTASAVNYVHIANAATGNGPVVSSAGSDTDVDLSLTPQAAGDLILDGLKWPQADGSADQILKTNGSGQTSWVDAPSGTAADIDQYDVAARLSAGTGAYAGVAAGDLTEEASPASGDFLLGWESGGALRKFDFDNLSGLPRGYIDGLITSRASSTSIAVTSGEAKDDTDAVDMVLSSAITKTEASWSVGTAAGGLDGSESSAGNYDDDTWYYIYLIKRSDTGVVDVLFSESKTTPTLPTNYDYSRLIGMFLHGTGGVDDIYDFQQNGDRWSFAFRGGGAVASYDTSVDGYYTTWTSHVIDVPPIDGIVAIVTVGVNNTAAAGHGFGWQHGGLTTASANYYELAGYTQTGSASTDSSTEGTQIIVDSSAQIQIKLSGSSGFNAFLSVEGWIFRRGKQ